MQGSFALSYLVQLFLARVAGFFRHWYADGSRAFMARYRAVSGSLEQTVASREMLHLLFRPLYGDYSVVGRIIGPIFRSLRLLGGFFAHLFIALGFGVAYIAWLLVPPFLIVYATGLLSR